MTESMLYTTHMITLHTLLVSAGLGFIWLVLLFLFCFCGVHGIRLAKYGWTYQRQKNKTPPPPPKNPEPPKEERAPAPQKPVYYIVEKKRTRQKAKYGEPKEIRFK